MKGISDTEVYKIGRDKESKILDILAFTDDTIIFTSDIEIAKKKVDEIFVLQITWEDEVSWPMLKRPLSQTRLGR